MRDTLFDISAKFSWMVDLTRPVTQTWSKSVLKKMKHYDYASVVSWQLYTASDCMDRFSSLYQRYVMERDNYRLDKKATIERLQKITSDPTYAIMWFRDSHDRDIGGIVIHLTPHEARIAYRVFDHTLARTLGVWSVDYYAESLLRDVLADKGYSQFYHGTEVQPLTQLGLSQFKLSVGAYPVLPSEDFGSVRITPSDISTIVERYGVFGYYDRPVADRLTHLFVKCIPAFHEYAYGVGKLCARAGVAADIVEL